MAQNERPDERTGARGAPQPSTTSYTANTPPTPSHRGEPGLRRIHHSALIFWLMFAINAVNYLDRFLVVAVGPILKTEFNLTDRAIGQLASAFLLVYTLSAIPLGLLADRVSRARVVAVGVAIWSVASTATCFVRGFAGLFVTRLGVGIGEASYYPAGTALLSAYFPLRARARVMSRWGAGQLVGMTIAFALAAGFTMSLGHQNGWRLAFFLAGPPGLLLAGLMWFVADEPPATPAHETGEAYAAEMLDAPETVQAAPLSALERIRTVLRIRTVWLVILLQGLYFVVATPAVTFLPIYMRSPKGPFHVTLATASALAGVMIVLGGISGVLLGGNLADWLSKRILGGRVLAAGIGFGLALPCYAIMLLCRSLPVFVVSGTLAVLALNLQAGPLTAAVQDAAPAALRASAVAVTLLLSHLLGDVWSPGVVGSISTSLHERTGMALVLVGMPSLALATIIGLLGARFYAADLAGKAVRDTRSRA